MKTLVIFALLSAGSVFGQDLPDLNNLPELASPTSSAKQTKEKKGEKKSEKKPPKVPRRRNKVQPLALPEPAGQLALSGGDQPLALPLPESTVHGKQTMKVEEPLLPLPGSALPYSPEVERANKAEARATDLQGKLAKAGEALTLEKRGAKEKFENMVNKKDNDIKQISVAGFAVSVDVVAEFVTAFGYYTGGTVGPKLGVYREKFGGDVSFGWGKVDLAKYHFGEMHNITSFSVEGSYRLTKRDEQSTVHTYQVLVGFGCERVWVFNPNSQQDNLTRYGIGPSVSWEPWSHFAVRLGLPISVGVVIPVNLPVGSPLGLNLSMALRF